MACHFGDATHAPITRGCSDEWDKSHSNIKLFIYLYRFLLKRVGKDIDVVFHEFKGLGWKNSHEMYHYWDWLVERRLEEGWKYFQPSDEVVLLLKKKTRSKDKKKAEKKESP